jgi:hypothetical protein
LVPSLSVHRAPCGKIVGFGALKARGGKLKAGSTARHRSTHAVAKPGGPSGVNSISRVDLPLARGTRLRRRVQRLFPLLLPQVEDSTPRHRRPHARRSPSKRRNRVRCYRATRVPGHRRVGTARQSWRKRGIDFMKSAATLTAPKVRSRAESAGDPRNGRERDHPREPDGPGWGMV